MTTATINPNHFATPKWLKPLSIIGVIWYAFGLLQFWLGFSMDTTAAIDAGTITAAHGAALDGTPALIWLAFALASGTGCLGAACLFTGSSAAKPLFALSVISALVYYVWIYGISTTGSDRPAEEITIAAVVIAVTFAFTFISRRFA